MRPGNPRTPGRIACESHNSLWIIQLCRATDGTMLRRPRFLLVIRLREGCFRTAVLPGSDQPEFSLGQPRSRGSKLWLIRSREAVPRALRATGEDVNRSGRSQRPASLASCIFAVGAVVSPLHPHPAVLPMAAQDRLAHLQFPMAVRERRPGDIIRLGFALQNRRIHRAK